MSSSENREDAWLRGHWAPPLTVLMVILISVMMGAMVSGLVLMSLGQLPGLDFQSAMATITTENTPERRNLLRGVNLLNHLFTFTGASMAAAILVFRRDWLKWLALVRIPGALKLAAASVFMLLALPWVQLTYWINRQVKLPDWMAKQESQTGEVIQAILVMESPFELVFTLVVIALLPSIGEELLFRGLIQQQLQRWWQRPVVSIWVTAALFSMIHFQFAGFLPRMLLGAGLGYLLWWTGSLWAPIIGHFTINAIQVVVQYALKLDLEKAGEQQNVNELFLPCLITLPFLFALVRFLRPKPSETAPPPGDSA
jgi:membrane protease YdiL (CAAX protease family)